MFSGACGFVGIAPINELLEAENARLQAKLETGDG
jgi:hypothetical protein